MLNQLQSRLSERLDEMVDADRHRETGEAIYASVHGILKHEAKKHGLDDKIEDSVGEALNTAQPSEWLWEIYTSPLDALGYGLSQGESSNNRVVLRLNAARHLDSDGRWDALFDFDGTSTWSEVLATYPLRKADLASIARRGIHRATELSEMVAFRIEIVNQVLLEFEAFGHVGMYRSPDPPQIQLDQEQDMFLDAALLALVEVREETNGDLKARRASWTNVMTRISISTGWSESVVKRIAAERFELFGGPAFVPRTGDGSGPPTETQRLEAFKRLALVMVKYARAVGKSIPSQKDL